MKQKISLALILAFLITTGIGIYENRTFAEISDAFIRFHVIANSDSAADQALKIKVRDAVLTASSRYFSSSDSKEASENAIKTHLPELTRTAQQVIYQAGYSYPVALHYGKKAFPVKHYANLSLPAGEYDALTVEIGDAVGKNWWCVLFPPLCFVDAVQGELPPESQARLKNILSDADYTLLTAKNPDGSLPFEIRFKLLEWFGSPKEEVIQYAKK